jgi:hypothetical protein
VFRGSKRLRCNISSEVRAAEMDFSSPAQAGVSTVRKAFAAVVKLLIHKNLCRISLPGAV